MSSFFLIFIQELVICLGAANHSRLDVGCVSAVDSCGRTIFIADAYRDDGKRFVVRADEKLTAFLELELAICAMRSRPGWQKKLAWKSPPSQLSGFNNPTST
ncbi:MAG: hypothetical protein DME54_00965 [Verrucomicrobia bacterium]|nr:MAG: hypothetical protein DME62_07730 [Verrucomicrobiota bacterium]PYK36404.1 MAG: hypothetical protein DME54_00965 [Verrucomicrobiota bacterium]PYL21773.1 MAG: hypothetical protein DMF41_01200 [Verrucomicrobiota bacterium]